MATVRGTWEFKERITSPGYDFTQNVNFIYNYRHNDVIYRGECNRIDWHESERSLKFNIFSSIPANNYIGEICVYSNMEWLFGKYKITFTEEQEVSDEFYAWFTDNAITAEEDTPIVTLSYNGNVMAYLFAGETATLHTKGQIMNGDIHMEVASGVGGASGTNGITPGLYDANDNLVASWDTLVNTYGMDVLGGYDYMTGDYNPNRPAAIISKNSELSNGIKMVFPDSLDLIGDYAFYGLENLTDVVFPKNLGIIGVSAFDGTGLSTVNIPNRCEIYDFAFGNCHSLTSVTLPRYIERIESGAFADCEKLSYVSMPEEVRWIGGYAFRGCVSLGIINLPQNGSLDYIGECAFDGCSLYNISLPSGLRTIGDVAFRGCLMSQVTIPASVTEIGDGAFGNCPNLKNIFVEEGNEHYSNYTFTGDDNEEHSVLVDFGWLEIVQFPGGITGNFSVPLWAKKISPYAFCGSAVAELTLPDSLENIGMLAFDGCVNLNILALPQALVEVGSFAFNGCSSLVGAWNEDIGDFMLTISGGLKTIADNMFVGCTNLLHIYIEDGALQIDGDVFLRCTNLISISIPGTIKSIGDSILDEFGDDFEFIFRGAEEAWNNVTKGIDNEAWLDKVIFWD